MFLKFFGAFIFILKSFYFKMYFLLFFRLFISIQFWKVGLDHRGVLFLYVVSSYTYIWIFSADTCRIWTFFLKSGYTARVCFCFQFGWNHGRIQINRQMVFHWRGHGCDRIICRGCQISSHRNYACIKTSSSQTASNGGFFCIHLCPAWNGGPCSLCSEAVHLWNVLPLGWNRHLWWSLLSFYQRFWSLRPACQSFSYSALPSWLGSRLRDRLPSFSPRYLK